MSISVLGEVWNWGMGEACGRKKNDVLVPERRDLPRPNAVQVDGGQTHSAVLTGKIQNVIFWLMLIVIMRAATCRVVCDCFEIQRTNSKSSDIVFAVYSLDFVAIAKISLSACPHQSES